MDNTDDSQTLEAIKDNQLTELGVALDTLSDNIRESIESAKTAWNRLETLELWDYFNDATSEVNMLRLESELDMVKAELVFIVDKLTE